MTDDMVGKAKVSSGAVNLLYSVPGVRSNRGSSGAAVTVVGLLSQIETSGPLLSRPPVLPPPRGLRASVFSRD